MTPPTSAETHRPHRMSGLIQRARDRWGTIRRIAREPGGFTVGSAVSRAVNVRLGPRVGFEQILRPGLDVWGGWLAATTDDIGFVQIGAFDGITNDPIHDLVERYGWRGIMVEPQPDAFLRLQQTYANVDGLVLLNAAVLPNSGEAQLWRVGDHQPGDPDWISQCASFDRAQLLREIDKNPVEVRSSLVARITAETVQAVSLADVFARAPRRVDVLQIDAEGFDAKIVGMLATITQRPTIVRFEHRNLSPQEHERAMEQLHGWGYSLAVDVDDTLAVRYVPGRGATTDA